MDNFLSNNSAPPDLQKSSNGRDNNSDTQHPKHTAPNFQSLTSQLSDPCAGLLQSHPYSEQASTSRQVPQNNQSNHQADCSHSNCAGPSRARVLTPDFDSDWKFNDDSDIDSEETIIEQSDSQDGLFSYSREGVKSWPEIMSRALEWEVDGEEKVWRSQGKGKGKKKLGSSSKSKSKKSGKGKRRQKVHDTDAKTKAYVRGYNDAIGDMRKQDTSLGPKTQDRKADEKHQEPTDHENILKDRFATEGRQEINSHPDYLTIAKGIAKFDECCEAWTRVLEENKVDNLRKYSLEEVKRIPEERWSEAVRNIEKRDKDERGSLNGHGTFSPMEELQFELAVEVSLKMREDYRLGRRGLSSPNALLATWASETINELVARPHGLEYLTKVIDKIRGPSLMHRSPTGNLLSPYSTNAGGLDSLTAAGGLLGPNMNSLGSMGGVSGSGSLLNPTSNSLGGLGSLTGTSSLLNPYPTLGGIGNPVGSLNLPNDSLWEVSGIVLNSL